MPFSEHHKYFIEVMKKLRILDAKKMQDSFSSILTPFTSNCTPFVHSDKNMLKKIEITDNIDELIHFCL